MDLNAYVAVHEPEWQRLNALASRRRLTGAETDELVELYQRTTTHLSTIRSASPDPVTISRLSSLLAKARGAIAGGAEFRWNTVGRFLLVTVPVAFYRIRWVILGSIVLNIAVAAVVAIWLLADQDRLFSLATPSQLANYANIEFEHYYVEFPNASFFVRVWSNNAWIAMLCIATGVTGLLPVYIAYENAVNLGISAAVMISQGRADVFFGLILPHGLLELTSVFVAIAAGVRLFWAWAVPGPMTRSRSLATWGRVIFTLTIGLALWLGLSGLIEGFVTPSMVLPPWSKIAIGVIAVVAFWGTVLILGRRAARAGETGDLARDEVEAVAPVVG